MTIKCFLNLPRTLLAIILSLASFVTMADIIAVIGTGNVGAALGTEFAELGHEIVYGSREPGRADVQELVARTAGNAQAVTPPESIQGADIVVLAVPGALAIEIVSELGDLSGKILIDPTNRVAPGEGGYFDHTAEESSNGEMIQALLPDTYVVKAFNVLPAATMIEPGGPVTIPLVGDNEIAKAKVAELVTGMGLEPLDVGPIRSAHVLEGMLTIWLNARQAGTPYQYHFRRVTPVP